MQPLIVPFFIPHAGCPNDCSFCNQKVIAGEVSGLPTTEQISDTVNKWMNRSPGRPVEVAFYGGSFTMLPMETQKQLFDAVKPLVNSHIVNSLRLSTRPDALSDDTLLFLKENYVKTVEIGVQSLDDNVLALAGRGHTSADSLDAIRRTSAAGFVTGAQLMPCLPGDTPEKSIASVNGVIGAGAGLLRIYPAIVLSGTIMAELYRNGEWQPASIDEAVKVCARMHNIATSRGVAVIRTGLQSDEGLVSGDTILAGPWHPAFGQLVRGELYFALIRKLAAGAISSVSGIYCHPKMLSDVSGHSGRNIERLIRLGMPVERIDTDAALCREEVYVKVDSFDYKGSISIDLSHEEI